MSTNNLFNSSSASNSLLSNAIAPGVYTQIIPSQQYNVTETGTNALICFFSDQGPDNVLTFLGSQSNIFSGPGNAQQSQNFIQLYGKPNLAKYTSAFGQGPYVGSAYSQISSSLYCLRLLPPNAQYANIVFGIGRTVQNQLVTVQFNLPSLNQISQLDEVFYGQPASAFGSDLEFVYFMPLFVISSTYRGSFYNNFQVYTTPLANVNNQFNFQIYQNTNGTYFQITSYNGSFNPNLLSNSGNTTLITSILDNYDPNVQIQLQEDNILSNSNYVSGDIFTNANEMYNVIQVQDCVNNINQIDSQYINGTTKFFVTSNAGGPLFGYSGQVVTITSSIQNGLMVYDVTPVTYNCNAVATSGTAGQIYSPSGTTTTNIEPGTIIITSKNNIYISVGFGDIMVFDPYTYCLMINATQNSSSVNSPLNLMNGGGDRAGTFNISTTVAFIAAAAGVKVAKHGNRSATSRAGGADVLEALGVAIDLPPDGVARCLDRVGMAFLFAPRYHPAMRHVAAVRRQLGFPTVFNLLGPLSNPLRPAFQIVGVFRPDLQDLAARSLAATGIRRALVVHGHGGLDELALSGPSKILDVDPGSLIEYQIDPVTLGLANAPIEALAGGDADDNARRLRAILANDEVGPARDVVVLNAAAALLAAGKVPGLEAGLELADEVLTAGHARRKLEALVDVSNQFSS